MATITHPLASSSRPFAGLADRLSAVWESYCYHRTSAALSSLSDHQLKVAGIARAEIPAIAARTARY